ncbi:rod shape-determining protein RodA [Bacteroidota bacterium]
MRNRQSIITNIDWLTIVLYFMLVLFGWINVYASVYNEEHSSIFDFSQRYGKQLIWILASVVILLIILLIDAKFFSTFAYPIYFIGIIVLVSVLVFGKEIAGSRSWFQIGSFSLQPSEFTKITVSLALAKYLSTFNISLKNIKHIIRAFAIILLPVLLVFLQNDTGSALVYFALILVLYREGLSGNLLLLGVIITMLFIFSLLFDNIYVIIGISVIGIAFLFFINRTLPNILRLVLILVIASAFVLSVDYAFNNFLSSHQKKRINVVLGKDMDIRGAGYNVHQSKIAIGSGGIWGKGFLKGTQTKYNFVPEQDTDFIFCTVGEEFGFIGSFFLIALYAVFLIRLIAISERQKSKFVRIYGYSVVSILFFHFFINIGMTIGIIPVIGIPLPFISYGGSSLWAFTILLFIFLRQDANRTQIL